MEQREQAREKLRNILLDAAKKDQNRKERIIRPAKKGEHGTCLVLSADDIKQIISLFD